MSDDRVVTVGKTGNEKRVDQQLDFATLCFRTDNPDTQTSSSKDPSFCLSLSFLFHPALCSPRESD